MRHYLLAKGTPSFLTSRELEKGKADWAETFTIDRARQIRGHVFERFFSRTSSPFIPAKTFLIGTRILVWKIGPVELKFWPEMAMTYP